MPILSHLADDPKFVGTLVAEINERSFFDGARFLASIAADYLNCHAALSSADEIELRLSTLVQRSLVTRLPALPAPGLTRALIRRIWPQPAPSIIDADRYRFIDYSGFRGVEENNKRKAALRAPRKTHFFGPQSLEDRLDEIVGMVDRIQERGGEVIFVRLPTSGYLLADEHTDLPRSSYRDVFAERVDALTIHFEDHPDLSRSTAPDGEHLDWRDAESFSALLGRVIINERNRRRRN